MTKITFSIFLMLALACAVFGQDSTAPAGMRVSNSDGPPYDMHSKLFYTTSDGSGTTQYICMARSSNVKTSVSIASISNGNPAVFTSTSHGFETFTQPTVKLTGLTGNWAALNGTWKVSVLDANTFSVPVDTTTFGAVTGTAVMTTNAPRTSLPMWAVLKTFTNTAGTSIYALWAVGGYSSVCSNRATLSYQ